MKTLKKFLNDKIDKCIKQYYNQVLYGYLNIIITIKNFKKFCDFLKSIITL